MAKSWVENYDEIKGANQFSVIFRMQLFLVDLALKSPNRMNQKQMFEEHSMWCGARVCRAGE